MRDIESREDILLIMKSFYDKLLADDSISYLFTEIAQVNLEHHFPILVDFWDSILFGSGTYRNNAMQVHIDLAKKSPLTPEHFRTWVNYLTQTVEENFEGLRAHTMMARAQNIAGLMEHKTQNL